MNFVEETDRELVKKLVQGTSTAPANVVGERAATLGREAIDTVRNKQFQEDLALNMLMEVIALGKAGKPWKDHLKLLKIQLEKAPIARQIIAEAFKDVGKNAVQSH